MVVGLQPEGIQTEPGRGGALVYVLVLVKNQMYLPLSPPETTTGPMNCSYTSLLSEQVTV